MMTQGIFQFPTGPSAGLAAGAAAAAPTEGTAPVVPAAGCLGRSWSEQMGETAEKHGAKRGETWGKTMIFSDFGMIFGVLTFGRKKKHGLKLGINETLGGALRGELAKKSGDENA